jgi:hypothetical protein
MVDILGFQDDLEKKSNGVKVSLGGDAFLLVAAFGTAAFYESMRVNRERIAEDPTNASIEENSNAYVIAFAETILLGWGGITENGVDVEYSREKATEWLSDPAKSRFFEKVEEESRSIENFRAEIADKEKKH